METQAHNQEIISEKLNYIAPTYGSRGIEINKGKGIFLYDTLGNKYFDCFSNYGVNILGHNNERLNNAIYDQLGKLTNLHGSFENEIRDRFSKMLVEKSPDNLKSVFYANSGAEAIEAAIKFAILTTGKNGIIAAKMGYHGKTTGALSLTKTLPKYNKPFESILHEAKHMSFNDADSLKELIDENTAAVFLEPIQGESGIRIPDKEFFINIRKICDEHNILLVIDEIQTGMGRTGKLFAIEHFGIQPDMMCLAKGLAAGLPIGAVLVSEKVSESMFGGCHTNTFGGNPLVCRAGIETLNYIEENNILENSREVGNYFIEKLREIDSPVVREIRGMGLMIAIELKSRVTRYAKELQDGGIITIPTGSNVIRLLPPLILSKENVDSMIPVFRDVLSR